jgi:formylmethanofuran dehydrogenase subunit D
MNVTEAVADTYLRATGKTTTLTTGTKYDRIIGLLDYYQRRWAREPGVDWNSLYDPAFSLGTVTATDIFDIDNSTVRSLSKREGDSVRIVWDDGVSYTDYTIVAHDKLKDYSYGVDKESPLGFYCAQMGNTLVFNHEFVSTDNEYGGEIFIPCYVFPEPITADNTDDTEVQVNDPDWLVTRVAAEYVRNDITRRSRYPELLTEANEIMARMIDENEGQIVEVDRPWTPFSGYSNDAWS